MTRRDPGERPGPDQLPDNHNTVLDLRTDLHEHVVDHVCDIDRRWFDEHPGEREHTRPAVDHELCPPGGPCHPASPAALVRVVKLGPGLRARMPVAGRSAVAL